MIVEIADLRSRKRNIVQMKKQINFTKYPDAYYMQCINAAAACSPDLRTMMWSYIYTSTAGINELIYDIYMYTRRDVDTTTLRRTAENKKAYVNIRISDFVSHNVAWSCRNEKIIFFIKWLLKS